MTTMGARVRLAICRLWFETDGQGLTEYALILALIALVAIAALTFLGGKVTTELSSVATTVTGSS